MFILKSAFCRIFQTAFRLALPIIPYREPEIVDSCAGLDRILKKEKVNSVLIVTDKGIVENGLTVPITEVLESAGMAYQELNRNMGIPDTLSGIKAEDIPTMAGNAEKEANPLYPVPKLMTAKELETFYYQIAGLELNHDSTGNTKITGKAA